MALVRPAPIDPSGTFTHALEILASIQASPSCNRVAASTLLDSCHSIEGSEPDAEASIEDYRSIYAAQLAMCEIESVNSVKPQSCDQLVTMAKGKSKGLRKIRKDRLSQCLQSLESRPQWWTSYSNNRQNAGVMCQAARIDIEKGNSRIFGLDDRSFSSDQLIKLHKSMVEASAEASTALGRATNEANAALAELQQDFMLAKRDFQDRLLHDINSSTQNAQSFLERVVRGMDAAVQGAMGRILSAVTEIESRTAGLAQVCTWSGREDYVRELIRSRMSTKRIAIRKTCGKMSTKSSSRLLRAGQSWSQHKRNSGTEVRKWQYSCMVRCGI